MGEERPFRVDLPGGGTLEVTGSGDGEAVQLDYDDGRGEGAEIVIPLGKLAGLVAAAHEQAGFGRVAVVPLPAIDLDADEQAGPFRVWAPNGGGLAVAAARDGAVTDTEVIHYPEPELACELAGLLLAHAEAVREKARVSALAALVTETAWMGPEDAARHLIAKGVTLTPEGGRDA